MKVLRSEHPEYQAGDYLYNWSFRAYILILSFRSRVPLWMCLHGIALGLCTAYQEYAVFTEIPAGTRKLDASEGIPWPVWLGVLGMPGQTSYMGWKEYSKVKKVRSSPTTSSIFLTAQSLRALPDQSGRNRLRHRRFRT